MWLLLAFTSAALLGFYDVFKKIALKDNSVVLVLTLNTFFGSLIFLPLVVLSATGHLSESSIFYVPVCGWEVHKYIILKSVIVLSSLGWKTPTVYSFGRNKRGRETGAKMRKKARK